MLISMIIRHINQMWLLSNDLRMVLYFLHISTLTCFIDIFNSIMLILLI